MTATLYPTRRADRVTPRPIDLEPSFATGRTANYAIRRTGAALVAIVVIAIAVIAASAMVGAIGDVGGRPVVASDITAGSGGAPIVRVHVAETGDTLWSIADRYRGEIDQDRFVDALIDVNGGTFIQVGQAVRLP